jgi:hypothetical protein
VIEKVSVFDNQCVAMLASKPSLVTNPHLFEQLMMELVKYYLPTQPEPVEKIITQAI